KPALPPPWRRRITGPCKNASTRSTGKRLDVALSLRERNAETSEPSALWHVAWLPLSSRGARGLLPFDIQLRDLPRPDFHRPLLLAAGIRVAQHQGVLARRDVVDAECARFVGYREPRMRHDIHPGAHPVVK